MAVLLVLYISPEGHNWGGLIVKSSFAEKKTEKAATINLFTLLPNLWQNHALDCTDIFRPAMEL